MVYAWSANSKHMKWETIQEASSFRGIHLQSFAVCIIHRQFILMYYLYFYNDACYFVIMLFTIITTTSYLTHHTEGLHLSM